MATKKDMNKTLKGKKKELETAFETEKQAIISIDNLIQDLSGKRGAHVQEMNRLQGEHRLTLELLGEPQPAAPAAKPTKRSK